MKTIQLVFQYTQSEYIKAERQYLLENKIIRKYDWILIVLFLSCSISYIFLSAFSIFSIIILAMILTVTALGSFIYYLMPILKFSQTAKYHDVYSMVFSKDVIQWETPSIHSEIKWEIYSVVWESNEFYYLIQGPRMYTLIPKRAFENQQDKQAFEVILRSNFKTIKRIS